jgi:hypothetical protein
MRHNHSFGMEIKQTYHIPGCWRPFEESTIAVQSTFPGVNDRGNPRQPQHRTSSLLPELITVIRSMRMVKKSFN